MSERTNPSSNDCRACKGSGWIDTGTPGERIPCDCTPSTPARNYRAGDKVLYYRIGFAAMEADVMHVSAKGRLSLNVHQGGAVPYYTATGVLPTSVHLVESAQ